MKGGNMKGNVSKNIAESSNTPAISSNISEYKIGHTLYIVELHFCAENSETLEEIVKRLISNNVRHIKKST